MRLRKTLMHSTKLDEFFWFWPRHPEDESDEALTLLGKAKFETARQLWIKNENEQSEGRVASHNLAVLYHLWALDLEEEARDFSLTKSKGEKPARLLAQSILSVA